MTTATMTGGEAVVAALLVHGVDTLFAVPGVQNDWLFNALYDAGDAIRVVHTRHEQGAGYLALGAAMVTGAPAVCSVVPGPGVLNTMAALATAYAVNAPVLCLAGQVPSTMIGRRTGVLHEVEGQLATLSTVTKWAARAMSPAEVPPLVRDAFAQLGSGRPRPVALEVPMDVLAASAEVGPLPPPAGPEPAPVDEEAVERAADRLLAAERPMLFVGSGAQGVSPEVTALAELLQAPVVSYRTGKGVVDGRSWVSLQQPAAERWWPGCDVAVAIGCTMRVPLQRWARQHRPALVRIDVDPTTHERLTVPEVAVSARAEDALPPLIERLRAGLKVDRRARPSRRAELEELRAWWRSEVAVLEPQVSYLAAIAEAIGPHGIFVDELTQVGFASRIAWEARHPRTYLSTGYQGTLGYGFPTALGAKVARPEVPVVSVTGDGGFLYAVGELATAVHHRIGAVVVVFDNGQYGNVQQTQRHDYGGRVIASDLTNPDFAELAATFGARAVRACTPEDVGAAIAGAAGADLPTVVHVPVGDMPSADRFR